MRFFFSACAYPRSSWSHSFAFLLGNEMGISPFSCFSNAGLGFVVRSFSLVCSFLSQPLGLASGDARFLLSVLKPLPLANCCFDSWLDSAGSLGASSLTLTAKNFRSSLSFVTCISSKPLSEAAVPLKK